MPARPARTARPGRAIRWVPVASLLVLLLVAPAAPHLGSASPAVGAPPDHAPGSPPGAVAAPPSAATTGSAPTWIDLTSNYGSAPSARSFPNMVWDTGDNYALLFGGEGGSLTPDGDTWSFSPTGGWHQVCSSCSPSGRAEAQMAYDSTDNEVVMNGGCTGYGSCPVAETWTYSQGTWHQITGGTAPIQDMVGAMADDPADGYVVMFGGCSDFNINILNPSSSACGSTDYLPTTWTYSAKTGWTTLAPTTHPSEREASEMVYDPVLKEDILYGGYNGNVAWNDTWAFHAGQWFELHPVSNPGAMSNFGMFWDPSLQEIIALTPDNGTATGGTTWAFAGGNWTQIYPSAHPAPRDGEVTASPPTGFPILYGGETNGSNNQGDTWAFGVPLAAQVSVSPTATDVGQSVAFSSSLSGGEPPISTSWEFGDGATSTSANTTHTYARPGSTEKANFTATDAFGLKATQSVLLNISALPSVTAAASPLDGGIGNTTSFWANATGGTAPLSYLWSFGDGGTSPLPDPVHAYQTPGAYEAKVTVSDAVGVLAVSEVNLSEKAPPGSVIVAVTATPTSGTAPLPVAFTSNVTGGKGPYTYAWSFGDGGTSTLPDPTYTYSNGGVFAATLTVTDSAGHTGNYSVTVSVKASPLAVSLQATPLQGDAPLNVTLSESITGGEAPFSFNWSFGDGQWNDRATTVQHTYAVPAASGSYRVVFTVEDAPSDGQRTNASVQIDVDPALVVAPPQTSPGNPPVNAPVQASVAVQGGLPPYAFVWSYGDGSSSGAPSNSNATSHAYGSAGEFNLTVTVTDANGASVASHTTVTVGAPTVAPASGFQFSLDRATLVEYTLFPALAVAFLAGALFVALEGTHPSPRRARRREPRRERPRFYSEPSYYLAPGWR